MKGNKRRPDYGYKLVTIIDIALLAGGIVLTSLAVIFTLYAYATWALALCWSLAAILLIGGAFWHLSMSFADSPRKCGIFHNNFLSVLRDVWDGRGKALDIGTGRGRVAITIATEFPDAQVIGVDTWASKWRIWGQTKEGAEENAMICKVSDRCTFKHGNALGLPFKDREFSLVTSACCFHEIPMPDRTVLLKEVVRVLVLGGTFMICDVFPKGYRVNSTLEFIEKVENLGVENIRLQTWKEAGLDLGGLSRMWGFAYLSGIKPGPKAPQP